MRIIPVAGVLVGTRTEAIKMAPVTYELQNRSQEIQPVLISTSQHRQMLDQVLQVFGITPDMDLNLMTHTQSLNGITCRVLQATDTALDSTHLDCLMI